MLGRFVQFRLLASLTPSCPEGIPTIVAVPLVYVFLPRGLGECRFLTAKENDIVRLRALSGRGHEEKGRLNLKDVFAALFDYKNYFQAVIVFCLNVSSQYTIDIRAP